MRDYEKSQPMSDGDRDMNVAESFEEHLRGLNDEQRSLVKRVAGEAESLSGELDQTAQAWRFRKDAYRERSSILREQADMFDQMANNIDHFLNGMYGSDAQMAKAAPEPSPRYR